MSTTLNIELALTLCNLRLRAPTYCFKFGIEQWFYGERMAKNPEPVIYSLYYVHQDSNSHGDHLHAPSIHDLYLAFLALDPAPPERFVPEVEQDALPPSSVDVEVCPYKLRTFSDRPDILTSEAGDASF